MAYETGRVVTGDPEDAFRRGIWEKFLGSLKFFVLAFLISG